MSDFNHEDEERLSRREAAERLVDIAYALTAGQPLELSAAGRRITVPVPTGDELRLGRKLTSEGDRVELELDLTWPIPEESSAAKRSRSD